MTDESLSHDRATLAGDFESIAEWRALKADEYPGDDRYTDAIEGLRRLAANVLALPDDDMRLHVIDAAWSYGCDPTARTYSLESTGSVQAATAACLTRMRSSVATQTNGLVS